jgi:hypothetical protein
MRRILLAGSLLVILTTATVGAAEHAIKVAGTRVFLSPPEGFAPSDRFSGFVKKDVEASLAVTEIHGPYEQVISSFSKGELASRGLDLTASSVIADGKGQGPQTSLIEYTQTAFGKKFRKVACIFGDHTNTTIVTGTMPDNAGSELFSSLKEAAKSARYDAHARLGSLDEGLPFTISDTKKFKKASRLQNVLLFTTTGKTEQSQDNAAIFAVGQSAGEVAIGDHETFARERLQHTPQVKNITIDQVNMIKQAGLDGAEFLAKAVDAKDGSPTFVFQTMLFSKDGYYIFQGLCPMSERAVNGPEYQQLVKNFQLRNHPAKSP